MIEQAHEILKKNFGFDEFRPLQAEIISHVLDKKDTLVVMPTGGGKSLCYQIPALIFDGLTIVISPLISLMKDQVSQLTQLGITAAVLNSSLSPGEYLRNVEWVKRGQAKLLYLAPEALLTGRMRDLLATVGVDCLAIDEAHCISQWGHDFRPEYRRLIEARGHFPEAVCVALTATATPRVRQDIKESLRINSAGDYVASFNRENLFIRVVVKDGPVEQTIRFIRKFPGQSGIVYCYSRKQVEDLNARLTAEGFSAKPYHAGLTTAERNRNQEAFIRDDVQIIVATIAFGMGIDKPNVRFVIHFDLPKNLESYYQEIGRAGRDGLKADCLLLFSYADVQKVKYFIDQKAPAEKRIANIHLSALLRYAAAENCRRIPLLNYFGENHRAENCGMCDNCLTDEKNRVDITVDAQKFLSCVKRTGERFGCAHNIDVLRGSKAQKVLQFGHHKLSTYGIGKAYSKKRWQQLSRQFLHQGLLVQDMEFGSLQLTERGWDVLRGQRNVSGHLTEQIDIGPSAGDRRRRADGICDDRLYEILRSRRKQLADEAGVPPYIIFPDKTLIEMAVFFPQSRDSLLELHGVGTVKCNKFGESFLEVIRSYCRENQIEERPKRYGSV